MVVQELLADPYLIAGRKINLRLYILATCDLDCNLRFYAYEDGFVYYAPEIRRRIDIFRLQCHRAWVIERYTLKTL